MMELLFESGFINTQPLREFEPLIRFDIDGNPQPRRPLNVRPKFEDNVEKKESVPSMPVKPNQEVKSRPNQEELKRKVGPASEAVGPEPKKKQQKQTKIMSFFTKKC